MAHVGPLMEGRGPGIVHTDGACRVGNTMSTLYFMYLFVRLFTEEDIFIEDGMLLHSSTALSEKKYLLTSSLAA
jgi:hypothetical protein